MLYVSGLIKIYNKIIYLLLVILKPELVTVLRTIKGVMVVNLHFSNLASAGGYFSVDSLYKQKFMEGGIWENKLRRKAGNGDVEGVPL